MKELDEQLKLQPDTQLVAEINKEYTLKGKLHKRRGLILFAVNVVTWEVKRVKINSKLIAMTMGGERIIRENRADWDKDCIYEWAINADRALYKVKRDLFKYILKQEAKQANKQ